MVLGLGALGRPGTATAFAGAETRLIAARAEREARTAKLGDRATMLRRRRRRRQSQEVEVCLNNISEPVAREVVKIDSAIAIRQQKGYMTAWV